MLKGAFPVIYPDIKDIIFPKIKVERLMTSVAFLNCTQKREDIHKVMNFSGIIFLDCGIFQRNTYEKYNEEEKICRYRDKLIKWYNHLKPDIGSSLDLPSSFTLDENLRRERLTWSIKNYKVIKDHTNIPLVVGVSVFSKEDIVFLRKQITEMLKDTPELLGIGGLVPLVRNCEDNPQLGKLVLNIIWNTRKNFQDCYVHVYGLGDHRWYPLIRLLGASSSDYAGYINVAGRGGIFLPASPGKYVLKKIVRLKTKNGIKFYMRPNNKIMSSEELRKLSECECPFCRNFDPILLEFDREGRILHNLWVVLSENNIVEEYCSNNDFEGLRRHIRKKFCIPGNSMKPIVEYAIKLSNRI